jgi:glycosyltransferase involved in cell wall biosynthesis
MEIEGMHIVFLRGAVPPKNEHPEKLLYDTIENCEDMWTQLFYFTLKELGATGELLYQNGDREFVVDETFTERWVPGMKGYQPAVAPDVIIGRGGFAYYDGFVRRFPKAKKIYYGAGKRFFPPPKSFQKYDLFLVDSSRQLANLKNKKGVNCDYILKPAALMFKPHDVEKKYDLCLMADSRQARRKRPHLMIKALQGTDVSVLHLGTSDKRLRKLAADMRVNVTWGGWSLRKDLAAKISQCRAGVCCSTTNDSCPRVIPEYLACDLPVLVTDSVHFWADKYVTPATGRVVPEIRLREGAAVVRADPRSRWKAREHYDAEIGLPVAAKRLAGQILKVTEG